MAFQMTDALLTNEGRAPNASQGAIRCHATPAEHTIFRGKLRLGRRKSREMASKIGDVLRSAGMSSAKAAAKGFFFDEDILYYHAHGIALRDMQSRSVAQGQTMPDAHALEVLRAANTLAGSINPLARSRAIGRYWYEVKSSQGEPKDYIRRKQAELGIRDLRAGARRVRTICSPSKAARTVHSMMAEILRISLPLPDYAYDVSGRGKELMTRRISAAIGESQNYAYVGDVASSFECFSLRQVKENLPLPDSAISNLLDAGEMVWRRDYRKEALTNGLRLPPIDSCENAQGGLGPKGLIPGAACSNIIQSWIFSNIVQGIIPPRCTLFIYSDNILLLGANVRAVKACAHNLESLFSSSPFGPFLLRGDFHNARSAFNFVGYQHSLGGEGIVSVSIAAEKWGTLPRKIVSDLHPDLLADVRNNPEGTHLSVDQAVARRLSGWSAISNRADEFESLREAVIDEILDNISSTCR